MTRRLISILFLSSAFAACGAEPDGSGTVGSVEGPGEPVGAAPDVDTDASEGGYTSTSILVSDDGSVVTEVVQVTEQEMLANSKAEQLYAAGLASSLEEARAQAAVTVTDGSGCTGHLRLYSGTNYTGNKICMTWWTPTSSFPHTNRKSLPSGFVIRSWAMTQGYEVLFGRRCATYNPYESGINCKLDHIKYDPSCDETGPGIPPGPNTPPGEVCIWPTAGADANADAPVRTATEVRLEPSHYNRPICGQPAACQPPVVE